MAGFVFNLYIDLMVCNFHWALDLKACFQEHYNIHQQDDRVHKHAVALYHLTQR